MNWVNPFAIKGVDGQDDGRDQLPARPVQDHPVLELHSSWSETGKLIKGR